MLLLAGSEGFCDTTKEIWELIGTVVTIFKIVIPVLIIIMGSIDLGKAVVSSDDKAIKSATGTLIKRIIIGVVIFFIPTIVKALFNLFTLGRDAYADAGVCISCITGKCNQEAEQKESQT